MGRCLREFGGAGDSARLSQVLQRHRELLHEYEKECRKIKTNIKEQRERFVRRTTRIRLSSLAYFAGTCGRRERHAAVTWL